MAELPDWAVSSDLWPKMVVFFFFLNIAQQCLYTHARSIHLHQAVQPKGQVALINCTYVHTCP
jgi:hypothetical protein